MIGKGAEPGAHDEISRRPGDYLRGNHQSDRILREEKDYVFIRGAEYFADSDFPCALPGGEPGEPEQSDTGDEYGEHGKITEYPADPFIRAVETVKAIVEKSIRKDRPERFFARTLS